MSLYPLKFEPIYVEKVWGGRTLESLGKTLPGNADTLIGESWEIADLPDEAGGARTRVANGPFAGRTLHELIAAEGPALMGRLQPTPRGDFPLLVKYLDARQNLSVQVHPDADYARAHADAYLKSEAWYVLDAAEDGVIYKGVREGITPDVFADHIEDGSVVDDLIVVPVRKGDCHYLPSGTCHALGAGVLVAEVQTPSDTTFRVYDWGRTDRELHVDAALQCIHFGPADTRKEEKRSHVAGPHTLISRLIRTDDFQIERVRMSEGYGQEIPYLDPAVWMILEGAGTITVPGAPVERTEFRRGETLLIPPNLTDARIDLTDDTVFLDVQFPAARSDLVA
jgi:mannose-6-phosphate isomerase